MGDFLGFGIVLLLAVTRPVWFMKALRGFRASVRDFTDKLPVYQVFLKSWISRKFLIAAIGVVFYEHFWSMAVNYFAQNANGPVMSWQNKYWHILVWVQLVLALWNDVLGRLEPQYLRNPDGSFRTDADGNRLCNYVHSNRLFRGILRTLRWEHRTFWVTQFSSPGAWLVLVAVTFLVQGWDLQLHALGMRYGMAQTFIALGFASKLVTGGIVVVLGAIVALMIKKGTRFFESMSTLLAKVTVGGALPGISIPDALKDVGGKIDFFDEDYLASFVEFLLNGPVIPLFVFDVAVFLCPHWFMAKLAMSAIVIVALFAWLLSRRTDATRKEVGADMEMSNRVLFKLSLFAVIIAITVGTFLEQTVAGRHLVEWVGHVWYGVFGHGYLDWYYYALPAGAGAVFAFLMFKSYKWVSARTDKHDKDWRSTPLSWLDKTTVVAFCLSVALVLTCTYAGIASAMGAKGIKFDANMVKNSVGLNPNHPPAKPTPGSSEVVVDFWTVKPALGAIVFENPRTAVAMGVPSEIWLESSHDYRNYHRAMFRVPEGAAGRYYIIMRNADEKDDELYGKVEVFGPYEFSGSVSGGSTGGSGSKSGPTSGGKTGGAVGTSGAKGLATRGQNAKTLPDLVVDPEFQELYGR